MYRRVVVASEVHPPTLLAAAHAHGGLRDRLAEKQSTMR